MEKRKYLGKSALLLISLALMILSVWEICVRMDAMYAPVKMFFSMAFGEGIPLSSAMAYFDFAIFEAPLWLAGCILTALLSIAFSSRPKGCFLILPLSIAMALYGLAREATFFFDFWRLIQPALLLIISGLSLLNLIALPVRRRRRRKEPPAPPRMTDAPRLRRIHHHSDRSAG